MKKNKLKGYYTPVLILILLSLLLVWLVFKTATPILEIDYGDIFTESLTILVVLAWIGAVGKIYKKKAVFIPLFLGFSLFFLGSLEDLLDEFFVFNISFLENLIPVGLAVISYGIIKLMYSLISKTKKLKIKNNQFKKITQKYKVKSKKLIKAEKEVKIKNKKLENTLEDFYELRVGMEKDKKKMKEENRKIRKKIDKLKK